MAGRLGGFLGTALVLLALGAGTGAAQAQMSPEEEQRCVWQCLANSPGAASREYQACVERLCLGEPAAQPRAAAPQAQPRAAWTTGGQANGARYAGVEIPGRSFSILCQRGGPALVAVAGLGGRADRTSLGIDGRAYPLRFVSRNRILYAEASPDLLGRLMAGSAVDVASAGAAPARFPLAGSGAAIRSALSGCGLGG
jgi:hypothetical protein